MSENTTPAMCSEAVYQAARAAGVLIVTTGEEAAIQRFADAISAAVRLEYTRPIGGGLTPDDDPLTNAYAEGRMDEAQDHSTPLLESLYHVKSTLASNIAFDMNGVPETGWDAVASFLIRDIDAAIDAAYGDDISEEQMLLQELGEPEQESPCKESAHESGTDNPIDFPQK